MVRIACNGAQSDGHEPVVPPSPPNIETSSCPPRCAMYIPSSVLVVLMLTWTYAGRAAYREKSVGHLGLGRQYCSVLAATRSSRARSELCRTAATAAGRARGAPTASLSPQGGGHHRRGVLFAPPLSRQDDHRNRHGVLFRLLYRDHLADVGAEIGGAPPSLFSPWEGRHHHRGALFAPAALLAGRPPPPPRRSIPPSAQPQSCV